MIWDYIVIGAGSAGCALAHELVKSGKTVLVIEAGGWDRSPFIKVAAGQLRACAHHDWGYQSQPDPSRNGARENWIRGRVLGGSSSINGTLYVRGAAADFDRWNIRGWSADEVMPLFREIEASDQRGPLRGQAGRLHVRTVRQPHAITEAFVNSAYAAGYPFNPDYNGETQEGVAYAQLSQRRGWRCSAADAFLKPHLGKKNLKLMLNATVEKIDVENGRAVAVSFVHLGKKYKRAARDIILSAGAINSPKLLMLSGIGDRRELNRLNVDVVLDLPGVGRNLTEQPLVSMTYRSKVPTYNLTEGLFQKLGIAAKFLGCGEGPISNLFEGTAFLKSSDSEPIPDTQLIFVAFSHLKGSDGKFKLAPYPSVLILIIKSYPDSRGRICLASSDPKAAPLIECRLLEEQTDSNTLARGIGIVRKIMKENPIAGLLEEEIIPGADVQGSGGLQEFIRNNCGISFHPIGTCRMGTTADTVVGPDLRVHHIENLWVADASIMPQPISANMNAPCIMIGMKLGKQLAAGRR